MSQKLDSYVMLDVLSLNGEQNCFFKNSTDGAIVMSFIFRFVLSEKTF
jgi:hypothetical protein